MSWTHRTWACPYYINDRKDGLSCEAARGMTLLDRASLYRYADKYCSSVSGWKKCSLAAAMTEEYERKEKDGGNET